MHRRRLLMLALAGAACPAFASTALIDALRDGGHVVYFRHAATTWSGIDSIDWPRERQRLLSPRGIEDSRRIGAAWRRHGLPVGEILSSPFARCRDMAELAFGRVEERMELLGLLSDDAGRPARIAYLRGRLSAVPTGGNRVIVSHRSNIAKVAGVALEEGDAAILRPDGTGFQVLGVLRPGDWAG